MNKYVQYHLFRTFVTLILIILVSAFSFSVFAQTYSGKVSKNHIKIEQLMEKGKYNQALVKINEILKDNPNDLNARAYLGSIYSVQYKLDGAIKEYNKILEKDPNNAAAHNGLGLVYYRRTTSSNMEYRSRIPQLLNQALEEFSKAIENAPNFYQAYNNAGKILFERGRMQEAESYFKKALELKPDYSEAVENYGKTLFSKNQTDASIREYEEAIRLNSRNSSAYYHLGEALIAKGNYSDAIKQLQTSLYLFPNSAPVHNMLGKAYELQGNEAAAIAEYKKTSLIKPEYNSPYLSLADIYKNRGDDEIAISELRNAVAINPNFHEAKAKIAEISMYIGKTDQAIKCFKDLLDVHSYRKRALKGLSKVYFLKAQEVHSNNFMISEYDFMELENSIKQTLKYDPDNLELYLALLRISRVSQKSSESEFYLNRIIKKSQDNRIDNIIKGEAYLTFKEFNNAEKEFIKALNQTQSVDDLLKLAEILTFNRTYSVAKIALNRALSIEPQNLKAKRSIDRINRYESQAVSKLRIAEGFYKEKQRIAAIEAYRDALSLNPYLVEAQLGIAKAFDKRNYYPNALEHYKAYVNLLDVSKDTGKYERKIEKLQKKIEKLEEKGKLVKRFTRI